MTTRALTDDEVRLIELPSWPAAGTVTVSCCCSPWGQASGFRNCSPSDGASSWRMAEKSCAR